MTATPDVRPVRLHPVRRGLGAMAGGMAAVVVALVASVVVSVLGPLPASQATTTYLCTGYDSCQSRGYSHAGYKQAGGRMYWRMYSGHNCTNYAAYRMVRSGMPNVRPWDGGGNAMYWGTEMARVTDDRPSVGAIAWWRANVPGAGSVGHVAYVERVISRDEIVVSEDSWGGDFGWKRITRSGTGWPSGFIHFNDRTVRPRTEPRVTGTPAVGETVRVRRGRWTPRAEVSVQWYAAGDAIAGATDRRFTPTLEQRKQRLTARVTARADGYEAAVFTTEPTGKVARGTIDTVEGATLTGLTRVGEVLEAELGSLTPRAATREVRWYADGERIRGADRRRLRLTPELLDSRISANVVSWRDGYRKHVSPTARTEAVGLGRIEVRRPFSVTGAPQREHLLEVLAGRVGPGDARVRYQWLRDGEELRRADGPTYTPTVGDVGHRLALRVDLTRRAYEDRSVTVPTAGRVTTEPVLEVVTRGKPERAVVWLLVDAPGVEEPGGEGLVRIGRRVVTGEVVDGRMRLVVDRLDRGRHDVKVTYAGTSVVLPGRVLTTVRVPRR